MHVGLSIFLKRGSYSIRHFRLISSDIKPKRNLNSYIQPGEEGKERTLKPLRSHIKKNNYIISVDRSLSRTPISFCYLFDGVSHLTSFPEYDPYTLSLGSHTLHSSAEECKVCDMLKKHFQFRRILAATFFSPSVYKSAYVSAKAVCGGDRISERSTICT